MSTAAVVSLRPVEDDDLPLFFEWQADEESFRMAAVTRVTPTHLQRTGRGSGVTPSPSCGRSSRTGVVGHALSWTGDDGRMIGYWLGKAYWGRGIASSALALFLEDERHRPLLATVAEHNTGSRRVLEKAGFRLVSSELVDDGPERGTITLLHFRLD